jgi:hypothetical protein
MKAYQINIAPRTGVGMGFVTVGEREPRSCRVLKVSWDSIKINQRQNSVRTCCKHDKRCRRPWWGLGRHCFQKRPETKQDLDTITASYVKEVYWRRYLQEEQTYRKSLWASAHVRWIMSDRLDRDRPASIQ